jgi:alkylation response protein AidB-like acyl-CoA dehydrogenase
MPSFKAPLADMRYLLNEVFAAPAIWQQQPPFQHCNAELADTILQEAARITESLIAPLNRPADEQGVRLENGQVYTADGFKQAYRTWAENGWVGLGGNPDFGGQGMPKMLTTLVEEMLNSASCSFSLFSMLTTGAALAIETHANEQLKNTYLPKLYSGEWAGAMAMTEAHAGTDLGLMRTKAEPQADGSYLISGTKIFITGGDHDLTDNIIHLVLAKLPDAPAGAKGISLFLVPKFLVDEQGNIDQRNPLFCGALEEKMGIHASSTCVMNYDNAKGYLIGEPNKGLAAMFTMMNYERLSVGLQGLGLAQLSYQGAVEYAKERLQSRVPNSTMQGTADAIIGHGDVRRMLMTQKAYLEAARAFAVYTGEQLDSAKSGGADAEIAAQKVALLTPVAKAFLTDKAFEICVLGQQVYGGHGYIREWGMEQLVRDARITQIYEGTNGIQAMDLLGRKVVANQGAFLKVYLNEILQFIEQLDGKSQLLPFVEGLKFAANTLEQVTKTVFANLQNPHFVGSAANDYLHIVGFTSFAYMWTKMAAVSISQTSDSFHDGKIKTGLFFMQRLLPQIASLAMAITQGAEATMALGNEQF